MRDSDLFQTAAWFLSAGADGPFAATDEDQQVELALQLDFETGYALDQVAATLDVLDTLLTAGFIAAEARTRQVEPGVVLAELAEGTLAVSWTVESLVNGSLRISATVKRAGRWASDHRAAAFWVLGGVVLLAPHVGIPLLAAHAGAIHIGAWAGEGAVDGIDWLHDRRVQQKKSAGAGPDAALPPAQVDLDVRPPESSAERPVPESEGPPVRIAYVYLDGLKAQRAAFRALVLALERVDWAYFDQDGERLRVRWLGDTSPIDGATIAALAKTSGVTVERIEETEFRSGT